MNYAVHIHFKILAEVIVRNGIILLALFLGVYGEEILEPDDLGEFLPVVVVKVSTGDNDAQTVVELVQDHF